VPSNSKNAYCRSSAFSSVEAGLAAPAAPYETAHPATIQVRETLRQLVDAGLPPSEVGNQVFDAIRNEKFYVLAHADWEPLVQKRLEDILHERNPHEAQVGPLKA
jgi:hypothetical protein